MPASLEDRIDLIRQQIKSGEYTTPARECLAIIEGSFRELYRRGIGLIAGADRLKVNNAEQQIGKGQKTVESFTLGQLVALFRNSAYLEAWANATGNELRGITMINLDQLVKLRNEITHINILDESKARQATKSEAELLLSCLQSILETFGILTLDSIAPKPETGTQIPVTVPKPRKSRQDKSAYSLDNPAELRRLNIQADNIKAFDKKLLSTALAKSKETGLVVVDLGCATGSVTQSRFSDERYAHILGIDYNESAISKAQSISERDDRFKFIQADLEGDGLEDVVDEILADWGGEIDVFFSALTIHHLANPVKLLRQCKWMMQPGAVIVLRGSDDGSKFAFPDPDDNVARSIEITLTSPGVSDRLNGRKLYNQLYRAGFRNIEILHEVLSTAGKNIDERGAMFRDSFAFRPNYLRTALKSTPGREEYLELLAELEERLGELELQFEDDGFYYAETAFGAIAKL
jgi:SAM-dependent methyltransferase